MAAREAARWAWCARAVFRAATAAARSGDGASSLRRIFDVTESAASGGRLRGCRPWVSVRTPSSDATTVRSFGCGYRSAAARSLASIRPTIVTRAFATAANDAPRSETGDEKDDRSSSAKRVCETSKRPRGSTQRAYAPTRRGDGEAPSIEETPKLDRNTRMDRHKPRPARPVHRAPGVPSAGAARARARRGAPETNETGFSRSAGGSGARASSPRSLRTKRSLGILLLA